MKTGLTDPYKERIRLEEEAARINTARRKSKKKIQNQKLKDIIETYSAEILSGQISWIPEHSFGHEKWNGMLNGKKVFKIEKWVYKYNLKVVNEEFLPIIKPKTKPVNKTITERTFGATTKRAEKILENYLKTLKQKDEVSKNKSTGR